MAIHPGRPHALNGLGFSPLTGTHPLASIGFVPATATIGSPGGKRMAVQPTNDPSVNQALASAAMPAYAQQLARLTAEIPGATLHATRAEKKPARLTEKIEQQGQPPATVTDYGAAQIAVDSPGARDAVVDAVSREFPVLRRQDRFRGGDPEYHYRSDTLQVQMPNQASEELQIVPREVMEVNGREHRAYKEAREAAIAGQENPRARDRARTMNDRAMEAFVGRNAQPPNSVVKGSIAKGARVRLADGSVARVLYVDPSMRIVRVRTDQGRNLTVRRKDLK